MIWIVQVLIGRSAQSLNRAFSYAAKEEEKPGALTRVLVDFGNSKDIIGLVSEEPSPYEGTIENYKEEYGIRLSFIKARINEHAILTPGLNTLAKQMADYYLCPLISIYQAMLPPSLKPKDSSLSKPKEKFSLMVFAHQTDKTILNEKQRELYEKILNAPDGIKALSSLKKTKAYSFLLSHGFLYETLVKENRIKQVQGIKLNIKLNQEQEKAIQTILTAPQSVVLLEGVTGSGKTIVYLEMAKRLLSKQKGSIILVPEIALTDQTAAIFKGAFGDKVSILHSSLSASNKYDEYLRIANGETQVVVGTRSAIFAPVKNLGLIVLDEEQSSSYKQDTTPFYDARTVAKMRAKIEGAKVVFSSATPLIEDRARAQKGVYGWATILHKFSSSPTVKAEFIDMSDLRNLSKDSTLLSIPLLHRIKETISNKGQVILFINRRGYSPLVQCKKCWRNVLCPNCEIPMIYHRSENRVWCHRCDLKYKYEDLKCQYCQNNSFSLLGYGTEKIEEQLEKIFPEIKVAILDRDTISDANREKILNGFRAHKFDVLIGTEMVVKGHDFPNVTLVAALSADQSLAFPSYLSSETTFDLISQLIGRSGRAEKTGSAIIQTTNVLDKTLLYASRQDYEGFYQYELANRKKYQYPPYTFICNIIISGYDQKRIVEITYQIKAFLASKLSTKRVNIYGPSTPAIGLLNKKYFKKLMMKYKDPVEIKETLKSIHSVFLAGNEGVDITIDIDARSD